MNAKRRIAATTLKILEAEGPNAVSMRRVAREVGVTAMAIYYYCPDRASLLRTVVDEEFGQLADIFRTMPRRRSFEEQMVHITDAYIDYALARPRIFDYVFSDPRPGARRFPRDFRSRKSPTLTPIADEAAFWMKKGKLKKDDIWEIAMEWWAHTHGYLMLRRAGRFQLSDAEFRRLVHRSLRRLLHGLRA